MLIQFVRYIYHSVFFCCQCELLLVEDGDFLVRESSNSPGQYVLSGRQAGLIKHLLLVDPEGIVSTVKSMICLWCCGAQFKCLALMFVMSKSHPHILCE